MIIDFAGTVTHTNIKFKGIKIGFSEIELGIRLNSIVTIYGELAYNLVNKNM